MRGEEAAPGRRPFMGLALRSRVAAALLRGLRLPAEATPSKLPLLPPVKAAQRALGAVADPPFTQGRATLLPC